MTYLKPQQGTRVEAEEILASSRKPFHFPFNVKNTWPARIQEEHIDT